MILTALHAHADQSHEQRDEGDGDRDDRGRDPVRGADGDDHGNRHDHREHELRQVAREVAVQRVDAVRRECGEVAFRFLARSGRFGGELLDESHAQLRLDAARRVVGRHLRVPRRGRASDNDDEQHREWRAHVGDRDRAIEGASDHVREQPRLRDHEQRGESAEHDGERHVRAHAAAELHEPRIDRAPALRHRSRPLRTCTVGGMPHGSPCLGALTGASARSEGNQLGSTAWYTVIDRRPIVSSAATAASSPGTTNPGRPVVSATNITAASGTR